MKLRPPELEYLSAWAREEKQPDPYSLPAHQLQAAYQVRGITLIRLIKSWARAEGRRDEDIFDLYANPNPTWPWNTHEGLLQRNEELQAELASLAPHTTPSEVGKSRYTLLISPEK